MIYQVSEIFSENLPDSDEQSLQEKFNTLATQFISCCAFKLGMDKGLKPLVLSPLSQGFPE